MEKTESFELCISGGKKKHKETIQKCLCFLPVPSRKSWERKGARASQGGQGCKGSQGSPGSPKKNQRRRDHGDTLRHGWEGSGGRTSGGRRGVNHKHFVWFPCATRNTETSSIRFSEFTIPQARKHRENLKNLKT